MISALEYHNKSTCLQLTGDPLDGPPVLHKSQELPLLLDPLFLLLEHLSWPCTLVLEWTISAHVGSSTFPTLKWPSIQLWIVRLFFYHSNRLTHSLGGRLLLILEARRFETFLSLVKLFVLLVLPCLLVIRFSFTFLIAILSFSYCLFKSSRFIKLNSIFVRLR